MRGSSSMKKIYISLSAVLILTLCIFLNAHANLIVNGDFNSGLDNWISSDTVHAVNAGPFAAIQGMDGNYALMGFGSTGTDSTLWQGFDVTGLDQLTISFNWAFDYVDWSSKYNDAFISFYWQDGLSNYISLQEIVTNGTLINPTTGLMYGFFTKTIDISSISGNNGAFLNFSLIENPGWSTESVVGIDNVSVTSAAPVPEPATLLLVGSGLLCLANFRRKSKKTK
jgi:hypothetical protein